MTRARRIASVAVLTAFGVVLLLVTTSWSPLHHLDHATDDALNRWLAPLHAAARFFELVSAIGRPATFSVLAVVVALLLWRRGEPRRALAVVVTVPAAPLLTDLVKLLVSRPRPVVAHPFAHAAGTSMPSGHALASTVAVVVTLSLVPSTRRAVRGAAVVLGVALVATIGFSRLALGVHYVSDVVAGYLLGVAWALTVPLAVERIADRLTRAARTAPSPAAPGPPRGTRPS